MSDRTYAEVVASGSYKDSLVATRDVIAEAISQGVPARDLAALTRRLLDIQKELNDLTGADGDEESPAEKAARALRERP